MDTTTSTVPEAKPPPSPLFPSFSVLHAALLLAAHLACGLLRHSSSSLFTLLRHSPPQGCSPPTSAELASLIAQAAGSSATSPGAVHAWRVGRRVLAPADDSSGTEDSPPTDDSTAADSAAAEAEAGADGAQPIALQPGQGLCYLVLVRQPEQVLAYTSPAPPFIIAFGSPPGVEQWNTSSNYPTGPPSLPEGSPPDRLLARLVLGGGAAELALPAPSLLPTDPSSQWTAYLGELPGAALAPQALPAPAHPGSPARLRVVLEHAAFTWAAGPRWDKYVFAGEGRQAPGDAFSSAYLPVYAPAVLQPELLLHVLQPEQAQQQAQPPPLPTCSARQAMSAPGAWWPPAAGREGTLGPGATGHFWGAHGCALVRYSTAAATACLAARAPRVHFLGDSNIRRAYKCLLGMTSLPWEMEGSTAGAAAAAASTESAWCRSRRGSSHCLCEDKAPDELWPYTMGIMQAEAEAEAEGSSSSASSASAHVRWEQAYGFTEPTWEPELREFDKEHGWDWGGAGGGYGVDAGGPGAALAGGAPTHVVFSVGQWEAAFSSWARFAAELPRLADYLLERYGSGPGSPTFVLRTLNFFAGVDPRAQQLATGGKVAALNAHAVSVLRERLGARLRVLDVHALGEGRLLAHTQAQVAACHSNHEHSEDIDVETQLLLNGLCN